MNGTHSQSKIPLLSQLRERFFEHGILPRSSFPVLHFCDISQIIESFDVIDSLLGSDGFAHIKIEGSITNSEFLKLGSLLGEPIPETDSIALSHTDNRYILNLVNTIGTPENTNSGPFSSEPLAMHTESSRKPLQQQPKYIVLYAHKANLNSVHCPQTLFKTTSTVLSNLSSNDRYVLSNTYYRRTQHPILQQYTNQSILCFRDFIDEPLEWYHRGNITESQVNSSITNLLKSVYSEESAFSHSWDEHDIIIFDNKRFFHGRSRSIYERTSSVRHLKRLRISPLIDKSYSNDINVNQNEPQSSLKLFSHHIHSAFIRENNHDLPVNNFDFRDTYNNASTSFVPRIYDQSTLDIFSRAHNPNCHSELLQLWLGRSDHLSTAPSLHPELVDKYLSSKPLRNISADEIFSKTSLPKFVKSLFNVYFRDHLYGCLKHSENVIFSNGAANECTFGLPESIKSALNYSLSRDWYGYSDSRGRDSAREQIARYESELRRSPSAITKNNIAITMGATQAISSVANFILSNTSSNAPPICVLPNYPPLVESISSSAGTIKLVEAQIENGKINLSRLKDSITNDTPLVFLQTVSNPSGSKISEQELNEIIESASISTIFILDECHDWLGSSQNHWKNSRKLYSNVIRVNSLSKQWSSPGLKIGWITASSSFIDEFYEFASTHYGGPPSIYYLLIEILFTFESLRVMEVISPSHKDVKHILSNYNSSYDGVSYAYHDFLKQIAQKEELLHNSLTKACDELSELPVRFNCPKHSINMEILFPQFTDSYACFLSLLNQHRVSFYPSVLLFNLCDAQMRLTYSQSHQVLNQGFSQLKSFDF